ncbi:MAG TPA: DMT family transporter [Acidimicrobiales bacterium]|nr:DMT family transporter [Acidimicrobiales bacterium]
MHKQIRYDAALLVCVAIWSLNFTAVKVGVSALTPLGFPVVQFALGSLVTVAIVLKLEGLPRFRRRDLPLLSLTAVCGVTINQLSFVGAVNLTNASNVALVVGTVPLWTALIALVSRQERLTLLHWLALPSGLFGTALIVLGGEHAKAGSFSLSGEVLALMAALTWSGYTVLIRPLMARYSALQISAFIMVIGELTLLPFGLPHVVNQNWPAVTLSGWLAVTFSAVGAVAITNLLYYWAIAGVGPSRAALYAYLEPFLGVVFAFLILGEGITPTQLVGSVIVIVGVMLGRGLRMRKSSDMEREVPVQLCRD